MTTEAVPGEIDPERTDRHPVSHRDLGKAFVRIAACEERVESYRDEMRENEAKFLTVDWDPLRNSVNRLLVAVAVAIGVGTVNSVLMAVALWRNAR